jgi:Predicted transcriptional regulator, contains C-terminal CBS domains
MKSEKDFTFLFIEVNFIPLFLGSTKAFFDKKGNLVGIITGHDVRGGIKEGKQKVAEVASKSLIVTYPDETLDIALKKLSKGRIGRLPVVSR